MKRSLFHIGLVIVPICLWFLLAAFTPKYLVARPLEVAQLLLQSYDTLLKDFLITFAESLGGLLVALLFSFVMAILFRLVPILEKLIMPYAIAIKAIPIIAIAPLLIIWFGNGYIGKLVLASLICFFPLLIGLSDGMKSLPTELSLLAAVWSNNRVRTLRFLELPFAVPYLLSALKVAAPLAAVGAVVAEFSGADRGLGHATLVAAYRTDTTLLFACIILISVLGIVFYSVIVGIEKVCLKSMRVQRAIRTF